MIRLVLLLSVVAGCTETIQVGPDPLGGLMSLEVSPADAMITVTELAPPGRTLQYTAIGHFADGSTADVTNLVGWSVDNTYIGALDGAGLFTATQTAAGHGIVTVREHGQTASTALTVVIDATIVDATFPPPAAGLFDAAATTGDPGAPVVAYPTGGTLFPQGVASTLFQYKSSAPFDAYRLRFESDVLHLRVETGADRWQASGDYQRILEGSGLASRISLTVDGTSSSTAGGVYTGPSIALSYSGDSPETPILFWSQSTSGIMRGSLGVNGASKLYPATTTCVGCHALSRDASKLAMGYDDTTSTDLIQIYTGTLATSIAPSPALPMGWATYSPDGTRLVVANNGILTVVDADSGAQLGRVPLPSMRFATHPDWSPDGSAIAVTLSAQAPNDLDVKAGSIARIPYNSGTWGPPEILVSGSATNNNYMPRWSPDGHFIAFVHATSASQGAKSAELMLVAATGGAPTYLATASHRLGNADVGDLANLMPAWGPPQPERSWLAFVSGRPYGEVAPTVGRGQIWITSLDLAAPGDSSTPAFWLPCQDVTVLNNNPVWVPQVVTTL